MTSLANTARMFYLDLRDLGIQRRAAVLNGDDAAAGRYEREGFALARLAKSRGINPAHGRRR